MLYPLITKKVQKFLYLPEIIISGTKQENRDVKLLKARLHV